MADGSAVDATPGKLKNEDCEMARLRKVRHEYCLSALLNCITYFSCMPLHNYNVMFLHLYSW